MKTAAEKYAPYIMAGILLMSIVMATLVSGCSSDSGTSPSGVRGQECTYDWQCMSNTCSYPGICQ